MLSFLFIVISKLANYNFVMWWLQSLTLSFSQMVYPLSHVEVRLFGDSNNRITSANMVRCFSNWFYLSGVKLNCSLMMLGEKQVIHLFTNKAHSTLSDECILVWNDNLKNQGQIHVQCIFQVCFELFDSGHDLTIIFLAGK